MTLEALLKHPALWKGRQQHNARDTLATGYAALDAALPSQGWPIGALTEIMTTDEGIGELSLILPALGTLTSSQQWIALVAPPYVPYAPALVNAGISLEYTLIIESQSDYKNSFWAAEQMLRSGVFSAVILWSSNNGDERQQRRLQLAAEQGNSWAVCYRPCRTAHNSSPAGLRMVLRPVDSQDNCLQARDTQNSSHNHAQNKDTRTRTHQDSELQIDIIKNRGGRLQCLHLGNACHRKAGNLVAMSRQRFSTSAQETAPD